MHILGRGATFVVSTGTVFVVGDGRTIAIDGLAFGGAPDTVPDRGIDCTNATLTARGVAITYTGLGGIRASGCTLSLQRSTVHNNAGGGIAIAGGVFAIANNYVWHNGNIVDATAGGVRIVGAAAPTSTFEFNTIVDNHAGLGTGNTGGVSCDSAGFVAANNVIARNDVRGNTTGPSAQTAGACTYPTSIVQPDVTGLAFVSPDAEPYSYKLGPGSIAIDRATTASPVMTDNDGDARPQGGDKDIGADELAP